MHAQQLIQQNHPAFHPMPGKEPVTITIPMEPQNLKYLQVKYGFTDRYRISSRNSLDFFLLELLRPKPRHFNKMDADGKHLLQVEIPEFNLKAGRFHLEPQDWKMFNRMVYMNLKSEFIAVVSVLNDVALFDIDEAIYSFIDKYDFQPEEMEFQSLKKMYYRFRKNQLSK